MKSIEQQYKAKLKDAQAAVAMIPDKSTISMGMRVATPPALLGALEQRARHGELTALDVYYMRCGDIAVQTIFQEDIIHVFCPYTSMMTRGEITLANKGMNIGKKYFNYVPITFSRYPKVIMQTLTLDAFLVTVAPMDDYGYFNLGINGDYAIELARFAKKLIVEVNENLPRTSGSTLLHINEVDTIVENTVPLLEEPSRPPDDIDRKIGEYIIPLVPNEATLQMGIGGVPNAVCEQLSQHKNLGIHTEVMTSGLVDLIKKGVITNTHKTINPYVNVFTFAIGDRAFYDFLDNNPSMHCLPVSYVNDPRVIALNNNMISINSFIEIDFNGQVNAEFIGHQFSGVGGQLDFIRGAQYSLGGKTILASHSTAGGGKVSKIVPRLSSIATDTRLDIDYIVTEYGCCRLAGKSTTQRAKSLINLAHPKFKDELTAQAKRSGFI